MRRLFYTCHVPIGKTLDIGQAPAALNMPDVHSSWALQGNRLQFHKTANYFC